ncbi:phosphoadenosine phosphosulfate reductase family protein [Tumebacillus sp. DT12]|uniref:Phosphoadenosine phosphosulfate reductase family protein n=1 Tax=Tumebacillus lacus TaxID=2995335 RepID=A0ABT3X0F1_9BACL|nr:phosphoadenosine phosphosulfate reductase family protein [Tumebacillus lacus]MCX7570374.1 phosphoadenosine phosphosulfate reductase family protein [Tumebacillus lacus]
MAASAMQFEQLSFFEDEPAPLLQIVEERVPLEQKVRAVIDEIKELYLDRSTPGPWSIACSFGKDSSAVLALVTWALAEIDKGDWWRHVHVVTSDTKVENPIMSIYAHRQSEKVNEWAAAIGAPLTSHIVSRETKRSFWYQHIGCGYPPPGNGKDRTCTHSLKIEPQNKFLQKLKPSLLFLGSRDEESARRARTIKKYAEERDSRFGYSPYQKGIRFYTPIRDWDADELWEFLQAPFLWGSSIELRMIYREGTGECGILNPYGATKGRHACGTRFGCWICLPITVDKSLDNMSDSHPWMLPLANFRSEMKKLWDSKVSPQNRTGFMRNRKRLGYGQGCVSLPTRKYMLDRLLATQEEVNELRAQEDLEPIVLISLKELNLIRKQWAEDEEQRQWLFGARELRRQVADTNLTMEQRRAAAIVLESTRRKPRAASAVLKPRGKKKAARSRKSA